MYIARNVIVIILITVSMLSSALASQPSLNVTVDSNKVVENTSFRLFIELENKKISGNPDFTILEKNFRIVSISIPQKFSWVNGKKSSKITWQLELMPNKTGKIIIPKLYVANLASEPIEIEVVDSTNAHADEKPRLAYLDVSVDNKSPYVQSLVTLNIELHHAPGLTAGSLTQPVIKDAVVIQIGRDKRYKKNNNGMVFYVLERKYAVFPQKSGSIKISDIVFDGVFSDNDMGVDSLFSINVSAMPVRATHPDIELKVKSAPKADDLQYWLPASHVELGQQWEAKGKLRAGEPIVRTLTVEALDITAEQLPNLVDKDIEGINSYSGNPKLENIVENDKLSAIRVDSMTYIPSKEGEIKFPAIEFKWWDINSKSFKIAKAPSKTFTILPIEKAVDNVPQPSIAPEIINAPTESTDNTWKYIAIAGILLWLLTIILWLIFKFKSRFKLPTRKDIGLHKRRDLYKLLEHHCLQNDAKMVEKIIIDIIHNQLRVKVSSLSEASKYTSKGTAQELQLLDKSIYSTGKNQWDGKVLWQLFKEEKLVKPNKNKKQEDDLPPLNP